MGEIADYYVDRILEQAMFNGRGPRQKKKVFRVEELSNGMLLSIARKYIEEHNVNESFLNTAMAILVSAPVVLSEKQRNALCGLLNNRIDKRESQCRMERLTDVELVETAVEYIKRGWINPQFLEVSQKIINHDRKELSERERNALYGLVGSHI